MLIADLLNGIIYESGNIAIANTRSYGLVAFLFPGILYFLVAASYILLITFITYKKLPKTNKSIVVEQGYPMNEMANEDLRQNDDTQIPVNKDIEQKDVIKLKIIEIVSISVVSFLGTFI